MIRPRTLIVANWKMNFTTHEASLYLHKLADHITTHKDVEVVLAPSVISLQALSLQIDRKQFKLAVQNFYWQDSGAYTGEVSASQLHGIVDYAIIGHSERRHLFHESNKDVRSKVQSAIRNNIKPIICVGDTAGDRTSGETRDIIHDQLVSALANATSDDISKLTIAYEPIWAISNGSDFVHHKIPTVEDVFAIQKIIRDQVRHLYGEEASSKIAVIYGGSVNSTNASAYLGIDGINGLLIGGDSLNASDFINIINQVNEINYKGGKK